ncbi:hypothetical protein ZHAS_00013747 [Anopheles sinensis]|uniref:Ionotropic receptor n=1 Tax=Anopheles sinensis TaxID=74873 RepID=A0A084W6C8_ANOSI|nr:hypothetical protein ZHAS_00013747 [Anopheles sinensis]
MWWQSKAIGLILHCFLMYQLFASSSCNLLTLLEAIASQDNATDISGTELCIFTTDNSTLPETSPMLLKRLFESYPTRSLFATVYVNALMSRSSSIVLLDATGFNNEFPSRYVKFNLEDHPCYRKSAKFVILLNQSSFADRMNVFELMKKLGILNFIVVQVELKTFDKLTVWTKNQFTNQENYFVSDHRPVEHFFPDKLHNLNGYQFVSYGEWDYPYIMPYGDEAYGVLINFVESVIRKRCNGTSVYSQNTKQSHLADLRYNEQELRRSFTHTLFFREQSGWYLVCPEQKNRDFLQPLLKPFSMGIWIVLGALYVTCRVLQFLFPTTYRYDLVGITFFGGGGTEYEHPFKFRIVTFTLIVLLFFLSEAYNTKLISLMTFSKFFKEPNTIKDFARSDYRILAVQNAAEFHRDLEHNFLSLSETRREERRLGPRRNEVYCSIMSQGMALTSANARRSTTCFRCISSASMTLGCGLI